MKLKQRSLFLPLVLSAITTANAVVVTRTATDVVLTNTTAWNPAALPTSADTATWDASSVLTNATTPITAAQTWGGLDVQNAAGNVSLTYTGAFLSNFGALNLGTKNLSIMTGAANSTLSCTSITGTGILTLNNGTTNLGMSQLNTANALNFNGTLALRGGNATTAPGTVATSFFYLGRSGITQAAGTAFALDTGVSTTSAKDVILDGDAWNGKTINLKSLSGTGSLRSDSGSAGTRFVRVDQASDTVFEGLILSHTSTGGVVRKLSFEKAGIGTLTLAGLVGKQSGGAAAADIDLVVSGGKLVLTAANTRTGATTVATGATLQVGDGSGGGQIGGAAVANNGTVEFNYGPSSGITVSNSFNGNGSILKKGDGTVNFTGDSSSFTGNITLNAGSLRMGPNLGSGTLTVKDGSFLAVSLTATSGTSQVGGLKLENNTESDFRLGTANDKINVTATDGLTVPASGETHTISILNQPIVGGTITLIDYNGTALTTDQFNRLALGSTPSGLATYQLVNNTANTSVDLLITLEDQVWKGSTDGNWDTTTTNWALAGTPGTPVLFSSNNPTLFNDTAAIFAVAIDAAGVSPLAVTFNNSANPYALTGGEITGTGTLIKKGTNSVALSQSNSYSGGTIIDAGKLQIGSGGTTGDIGSGAVSVAAGATLEFNRSNATPGTADLDYKTTAKMRNVSGQGDIVLTGGLLFLNYTGSGTGFNEPGSWAGFSGNLTVKGGSEFLTIRNGATAMGTGDVILGDATTSGSLSIIDGNWTWTNDISLVGSDNWIRNRATSGAPRSCKLQGVISGSGGITFDDTGDTMTSLQTGFILTGTNMLGGTLTITAGTPVRVGGVPGDTDVNQGGAGIGGTLGAATVVNNGTLTFSRSDAHTVSNLISGTGNLVVGLTTGNTAQVMTYTGTASHSGTTTVSAGTLVLASGASVAGSGVTVAAGATLAGEGTVGAPVTAAGTIAPGSGVGNLTVGNTVLTGTYACDISGATSDKLIAGTLDITGATLVLTGTPTAASYTIATYTGALMGSFNFTPPNGYALSYASPGEIKLVQSGSDFENWIGGFYPGETNPAIIGIDADPDNDGIDNGLEFALKGGNPAVSGGTQLPTGVRSGANFIVTFQRDDRAKGANAGVTLTVEAGTTLAAWPSVFSVAADTASSTLGVEITNDADANPDTVTVTIPTGGAPALFARLKVSETP